MQKRIKCKVFGRVQLVMYRDFATRTARKLGIVGTVQNEPDGTVVVIAEGEESLLNTFIKKLEQGSLLSSVDRVLVAWMEPNGELKSFTIRY